MNVAFHGAAIRGAAQVPDMLTWADAKLPHEHPKHVRVGAGGAHGVVKGFRRQVRQLPLGVEQPISRTAKRNRGLAKQGSNQHRHSLLQQLHTSSASEGENVRIQPSVHARCVCTKVSASASVGANATTYTRPSKSSGPRHRTSRNIVPSLGDTGSQMQTLA